MRETTLVDPAFGEEVPRFKHVNYLSTITAVADCDLITTVGESGSMTKDATIVRGPA